MSINNFGIVSGRIYRSAQPDATAWKSLRCLGVAFAVKLNSESEYPAARESMEAGPGVQIIGAEISQWSPDVIAVRGIVAQVQQLDPGSGVLIHCMHGRDRTGLIAGAFRLIANRWPLADVQAERAAYGVTGVIALADHEISETLEAIAKQEGLA